MDYLFYAGFGTRKSFGAPAPMRSNGRRAPLTARMRRISSGSGASATPEKAKPSILGFFFGGGGDNAFAPKTVKTEVSE